MGFGVESEHARIRRFFPSIQLPTRRKILACFIDVALDQIPRRDGVASAQSRDQTGEMIGPGLDTAGFIEIQLEVRACLQP